MLGVHPATVCRELKRNARRDGAYFFWWADADARKRRRESKRGCRKIESDPVLRRRIKVSLHPLRSPEVVAHEVGIAHETIYAWLDRSRPDLKGLLPYHGKKRRRYGTKRQNKRGWTKLVRPIDDRRAEANDRSEVGHWEGDTARGVRGHLLPYVDRMSRYAVVDLIPAETADVVREKTRERFPGLPCKTITYDRGSTFALWNLMEKETGAEIYFAHPHHPWERGTCENTIGRLRRIFPKGFDFGTITQKELDGVVHTMNHTPRKCLNWRTPCDVFGKCCASN